jgi:hypothetical protein
VIAIVLVAVGAAAELVRASEEAPHAPRPAAASVFGVVLSGGRRLLHIRSSS